MLPDRLSRIIKTWKRKEREGVQEERKEVGCGMAKSNDGGVVDEDGRWTGMGRKRTSGQRKGESSPNMILDRVDPRMCRPSHYWHPGTDWPLVQYLK